MFKRTWLTASLSLFLVWLPSLFTTALSQNFATSFWRTSPQRGSSIKSEPISLAMHGFLANVFQEKEATLEHRVITPQRDEQHTTCPAPSQKSWSERPDPPALPKDSLLQNNGGIRKQVATVLTGLMEWQPPEPVAVTVATVEPERPSVQGLWQAWRHPVTLLRDWQTPPASQPVQIWVNHRVIATVQDLQFAQDFAQQIEYFLAQPGWDAEQLVPARVGDKLAVRIGDRLLIVLDETILPADEYHPELLVIDWTNNLRQALGHEPLELVVAQQLMYGITETPEDFEGLASWYGPTFHGRLTANGETYDQEAFTAAHPSLPFNTYLKVISLESDEAVIVRINDRGPYIQPRTLDLSRGVARCIESKESGVVRYRAIVMTSS